MHLRRRMHHPRLYQDKRNALQLGAQLDAPVLNMGGDVAPTPLKILPPSFGAAEVGRQQAVRGPATADRVIARGFDSAVPLIGVAGAKGRGVRRGNRDCGGGDEGAPVCFCRGNWVRFGCGGVRYATGVCCIHYLLWSLSGTELGPQKTIVSDLYHV
jgi:hypothetical protein